ncbi:hypothetical protein HK098_001542 [Nowakowskiella sp. JEL0407]|nr:hypothetical protein HK098_001542 [Nowakowskiella sp. JEL0407]
MSVSPFQAKIIDKEEVEGKGRFVKLHKITYLDPKGEKRPWESAERTTRKGEIDAVAVFSIIKNQDGTKETALISQFRPPTGKVVLELPAGLVDAGETPEQAAIRELHEETGLIGKAISTSPITYNDCGMSNSNMRLVLVEVDKSLPENQNPKPKPDEGEFIDLHLVPTTKLMDFIFEFDKKGGTICSRLYHIAQGLQFAITGF